MNTSISNPVVETSLTPMVSGAESPMQGLKAGNGKEPSAFSCLMAQHCSAPEDVNNTAAAGVPSSGEIPPILESTSALESGLQMISGMLGMSEEIVTAEAMVTLPQGVPDGNPLPLAEIVAALEGAAEALEGVTESAQHLSSTTQQEGQQMDQLAEQAQLLSDASDPQLAAQLEALEQSTHLQGKGAELQMDQTAEPWPPGLALGYRMLQQISGPIGQHLGQHDGQEAAQHVGLQLGHQLRQQVVGQEGRSSVSDGTASTVVLAGSSGTEIQDELNAQLSQLALRSAQAQTQPQDTAPDLSPTLVRAAAGAEMATLPQGAVAAAMNAAMNAATAAPATAPTYQAPPVLMAPGDNGWDQAMGERILWMVGKQIQGAEVRINPPHLGPVEIRLSLQHDQASVSFAAHHAGVREALEAAIPRLREMLGENNLQLVSVDVGQRDKGEQRGPSDFLQRLAAGESEHGQLAGEGEDGPALPLRTYYSEGMVDYYA